MPKTLVKRKRVKRGVEESRAVKRERRYCNAHNVSDKYKCLQCLCIPHGIVRGECNHCLEATKCDKHGIRRSICKSCKAERRYCKEHNYCSKYSCPKCECKEHGITRELCKECKKVEEDKLSKRVYCFEHKHPNKYQCTDCICKKHGKLVPRKECAECVEYKKVKRNYCHKHQYSNKYRCPSCITERESKHKNDEDKTN